MSDRPIPYGRQTIEDDDVEAVVRVLRSDFLTTGPEVPAFEQELAAACEAPHAVAVSNGTAALHCAYAAAGIGPGDEVITTPLTFSATSNMLLALGAVPRFVDVDLDTLCLDPAQVEAAIGPRTRGIAAVDYAGHPAPMVALKKLADAHGLVLVEDAAHSIGSRLGGHAVGSLADLTTFSFHPVKTITTGEGGAVLTNDAALAMRARDFRNHGMVRDAARLQRNDGPWYYEIQSIGLNYRLTDVQCALGRSQLRKLARFSERRTEIVAQYTAAFADEPRLRLMRPSSDAQPSWHLFVVRVKDAATRARFFAGLHRRGILAQVHYVAVNDMPLYRGLGHDPAQTPIAMDAAQTAVSLPLYPALTDEDVARVVRAVRDSLGDG